jgi:hypothetical protein
MPDNYTHPSALERTASALVSNVFPADRKYFADNPGRNFRVRPPFVEELAQWETLSGEPDTPEPPGRKLRVIVKQIRPGVRMRMPVSVFDHVPIEIFPDDRCRELFDIAARQCHEQGLGLIVTRALP